MSRRWQHQLPHDVYVIADQAGAVLYVGISMNTERRLLQHRLNQWFSKAASVHVSTYANYEIAKHVEGKQIAALHPSCNRQREHWSAAKVPVQPVAALNSWERDLTDGR